jgi:hypothetical protein
LAGPYDLLRKTNPKERLSLCITDKNQVLSRKYEGKKLTSTMVLAGEEDFGKIVEEMERIIIEFKKDYDLVEDLPDDEPVEPLIGKRGASPPR